MTRFRGMLSSHWYEPEKNLRKILWSFLAVLFMTKSIVTFYFKCVNTGDNNDLVVKVQKDGSLLVANDKIVKHQTCEYHENGRQTYQV